MVTSSTRLFSILSSVKNRWTCHGYDLYAGLTTWRNAHEQQDYSLFSYRSCSQSPRSRSSLREGNEDMSVIPAARN